MVDVIGEKCNRYFYVLRNIDTVGENICDEIRGVTLSKNKKEDNRKF